MASRKRNKLVPDIVVKFRLDDRPKQVDFQALPFPIWPQLKALGYTPQTVIQAVSEWDVEALVALVWLERVQREPRLQLKAVLQEFKRAGETPSFALDEIVYDGQSFYTEGDEDDEDDEDDAGEDPTPAAGPATGTTPG